jgi:hypothetical protein
VLQIPASEKVEALMALARLVSHIDMAEASVIFAHAHEATSEIDADAGFQLKALSSLVEKALPSLTTDEQKIIANALTSISTSAAIRLQMRKDSRGLALLGPLRKRTRALVSQPARAGKIVLTLAHQKLCPPFSMR